MYAENIYQSTFRTILADRQLKAPAMRALFYLYSEMEIGETKQISLAELVNNAFLVANPHASRALASLEKLGYIEKWRKGNDLFIKLLAGK